MQTLLYWFAKAIVTLGFRHSRCNWSRGSGALAATSCLSLIADIDQLSPNQSPKRLSGKISTTKFAAILRENFRRLGENYVAR